ncbi:hypothetical protein B5E56_13775 [Flavonifractor sp. An112]|uniref:plasmid mobilization protein n=1 Tax=Flavonifractor sp. An112 TaxID=1965544 RepID=UPI000B37C7B1|nr:hypothetical protein [Flavonifractor sp. An112]OUQ55802.1 hypothetical protein B5E56_13775 [Flavonifractor sp. An112]
MSQKCLDRRGRWRNKVVSFRISPEEDLELERAVRLSGLTKQEYITRRILCRDVIVQGNPRVYKALRNELNGVVEELKRLEPGMVADPDMVEILRLMAELLTGMKEGSDHARR